MPKATAGAIIINEDNKVLLTRRNISPFKDYWCLPGGHINNFETAKSAVIREVKEETGLDIEPKFLTYIDEIHPSVGVHNVVMMFYGKSEGELKADPVEVSDIKWFDIKDALNLSLAFEHKKALEIYLKG